MVITSPADPTNTLVSLGRYGLKRVAEDSFSSPAQQDLASGTTRRTQIRLPEGTQDRCDDGLDCRFEGDGLSEDNFVYLPAEERHTGVDGCLAGVPVLQESRKELLTRGLVRFSASKSIPHTFLYVAQGEIAHCTASQHDFLVSDKATTCHILALRSTSFGRKECEEALCTVTHIDGTGYSECLRAAVKEHAAYHGNGAGCAMDVHIVGGYEDRNGTSRDLSNWLLEELATLADDFYDTIEFTLQMACITRMNTSRDNTPIARGLALNCKTGQVSLAQCRGEMGPAEVQRSARLWVPRRQQPPTLHLVYTHTADRVTVQPFQVVTFIGLEAMLKLPDHMLLRYCSTPPDCEEAEFVPTVRRTLQFLCDHAGFRLPRLEYRRCSVGSNQWVAT